MIEKYVADDSYAVVYITCQNEDKCNKQEEKLERIFQNYKRMYAKVIPNYVKRIDLIIASRYHLSVIRDGFRGVFGAEQEGEKLRSWFLRMYPTVDEVNVIIEESTTVTFSMLMMANYLVCTGASCIIPALSNKNYASILMEQSSFTDYHHMRLLWWKNPALATTKLTEKPR